MDVGSMADQLGSGEHRSSRARVVVVVGAALLAFLVIWLVVWANGAPNRAGDRGSKLGTPIAVDRPAPPFSLKLLTGSGSLGLQRYAGEVVVLNFWASTCPPCRKEVPELADLSRTYRSMGVRVLGVDYADASQAAIAFARSHGMTYPSVIDRNGRLGEEYGIFGLPTTFIIGSDGRIHYAVYGRIHPTSFRPALDGVIAAAGPSISSG
jgi:DsbE subfamily thiol:disulfide oxidoreductase